MITKFGEGALHGMRDNETEARYWNEEILAARGASDDAIWYRYMEGVYGDLIARAIADAPPGRSLKTDLYEEARGAHSPLAHLPHPRGGIDQSDEVVAAARLNAERLGVECDLVVGDVRDLPFSDGHFHFVLSGSTLDHFARREDIFVALNEISRVLAPGGTFVLTLDNPHNPMLVLRRRVAALSRLRLRPYFVGETLSIEAGIEALGQAGLEVRGVRAVAHAPRDPAMRLARLGARFGPGASTDLLLGALRRCEALEHMPSRRLTGYYLAFEAVKPPCARGPAPARPPGRAA